MTADELDSLVRELYPDVTPRQAVFKAVRDNLIGATQRDMLLIRYPDEPAQEVIPPRKMYTLKELRLTRDPWTGKEFADFTSEELDEALDSFPEAIKQKALAYLEMRGFK